MKQLNNIPAVSIVIVSYRVPNLLKLALQSLYKFNNSNLFEVIVIDNASGDETEEILAIEFPQVKSIINKVNLGFPAANNQGFLVASGNYILEAKMIYLMNSLEEKMKTVDIAAATASCVYPQSV
jgi:GT2 family glycosyltransferase